jgi:hypothetical protein
MAKKRDAFENPKGIGKYTSADAGLRSVPWNKTQGDRDTHDIMNDVTKNADENGGFSGGIKHGVD